MTHDYFRKTLELRIQKTKEEIDSKIEFLRQELFRAAVNMQSGRSPNSCGIVQTTGTSLDQDVVKLDLLVSILKDYENKE